MAHIPIPEGMPGIRGLFAFRPASALPLNQLVDVLLRGESPLAPAERELIATFVSAGNDCNFCQTTHGAIAAAHLGGDEQLVRDVKRDYATADISPKLKALLGIAGKVREGGKHVTDDDVAAARAQGATDTEIHDTVLIAAAFCMFNRYVDGLATWTPEGTDWYRERARVVARVGYLASSSELVPALADPRVGE